MQAINQFDPTASTGAYFDVKMPNGGWLALMNESVVGLQIIFGDGSTRIIPPFFLRVMRVTSNQMQAQWQQYYSITGGQAPTGLNLVTGEAYDPAEWTNGELMISLPRMVNVGNATSGGTVADLINDGNVAGTQIIESTASGSPGSNVLVTNDGKLQITVLSNNAQALVLSIIPGDATHAATVLLHGIADSANAVPAAGVTAGALPAGVTIPGGQVSGAVASATSATSATSAGSASSVPASGVSAGTLPANVHETQINSDGGAIASDGAGALTLGRVDATGIGGNVLDSTTVANAGIEHGSTSSANTPFFDWHASGFNNDFDIRMIAFGGVNGTNGAGTLTLLGRSIQLSTPDGGYTNVRPTQRFIGTVDPTTYATVNEGDYWDKG